MTYTYEIKQDGKTIMRGSVTAPNEAKARTRILADGLKRDKFMGVETLWHNCEWVLTQKS